MKTKLALFLVLVAFCTPACSQYDKVNNAVAAIHSPVISTENADKMVDVAEKTAWVAAETFTEFLTLDRRYHDQVKAKLPSVHNAANSLRQKMGNPPVTKDVYWLKKLRRATETFRLNRTPEGQANLLTALATVQSLLDETKSNILAINRITQ